MGRGFVSSDIDKKDVIESFVRSSGPGGQHVNKTSTCVQLLHVPTGISVKCQESRRQEQNRTRAWQILKQKIEDLALQKKLFKKSQEAKIKRQERKRSLAAKERILQAKKHRSSIKSVRVKVRHEQD